MLSLGKVQLVDKNGMMQSCTKAGGGVLQDCIIFMND